MCKQYDAEYTYKKTAWEMKLVAGLLDAFDITDKDAFMKNYATTVGRTIYPNFKVGTTKVLPITQTMLAAHEFGHIWLHDDMGSTKYNANYIGDVSQRGLGVLRNSKCIILDFDDRLFRVGNQKEQHSINRRRYVVFGDHLLAWDIEREQP